MRAAAGRLPWAFCALCAVIALLDLIDGNIYYGDADDRLRALQIADLLADGDWFDRTLPFVAMPEAYVSPWSRLVDLPYVVVSLPLLPLLGMDTALAVSAQLVPPLLVLAFAVLALAVMRAVSAASPSAIQLAVTALAMTYALWAFAPGRVDHHNVQLLLMMVMLAGLCAWENALAGGVVAGVAITLSVAVGLECLPFIAAVLATITAFALAGGEHARKRVAACGVTLVIAAPLAGLVLVGPQAMFATSCDAWSAPWIAALAGGGFVLAGTATGIYSRMGMARRFGFAGLGAIALVISLAAAFPSCLQGPYAMIGEAAQRIWLDRVPQESSILLLIAERRFGELATLAVCGFILIATGAKALDEARAGRHGFVLIWLVGLAALLLTILQVRFIRFAPAFAPLLLPWLMMAIRETPPRIAKSAIVSAAVLPAGALILALVVVPHREHNPDAVDLMMLDACEEADFSVLASREPGRIIAPLGISMPIAQAIAKGKQGHTVSALPFHRASPGIARVATAFTSSDAAARKQALAPFDMAAVCARETHIDISDAPLYAALVSGKGWPGLEQLVEADLPGLHLYRIDHEKLR